MSGAFNLHLGPVSLGTDGFAFNYGLKVGAEIDVLGVGIDANAALTTGEFGAKAEAYAQHTSNWYALQPITCPARAFGNLLKQVDSDYGSYVPDALRIDGPGIYERLLEEVILPKLEELGWKNLGLIRSPKCIYGRFRIELAAGGHLFLKYGMKDSDGFQWYGVSASMAVGAQVRLAAAVGLLGNDACQIRVAVGNLRLSFILSTRPLGLRNDEESLDSTTLAEKLAFRHSTPAKLGSSVHGTITIDGASANVATKSKFCTKITAEQKRVIRDIKKSANDATFVRALETAIAGALTGLVDVGCVSVHSAGGDSRLSHFKFHVSLDDMDAAHAAQSVLEVEAASGGTMKLMSVLPNALENAGLCNGHLRIVNFQVDSQSPQLDSAISHWRLVEDSMVRQLVTSL